jgi:hypothetical protein
MATLFILAGALGLVVTRLGWMDPGGLIRRLDWFRVYRALDHKYVGEGTRRASYLISGTLLGVGVLMTVREVLRGG